MSEPRPESASATDATFAPVAEEQGHERRRIEDAVQAAWAGTLLGDERPEHTIKAKPGKAAPELLATLAAARRPDPSPVGASVEASVEAAMDAALGATLPPGAASPSSTPTPADLAVGATMDAAPKAPPDPRPDRPAAMAGFEVLRLIGRGGMGAVYAARQASLAREVALKMVLQEYAQDPVAAQRFLHEALVTGDLDHPNIVPVHDLGRDADGNLYMAMKLVRGTPWDRLLHPASPGAPLSRRDHLEILRKVCDAMAFAHARGVVHRDLKPENVMVGDFGEVLVMDWGIALDVSERPGGGGKAEHKSATQGPAGTPRYMAPELALVDVARIGPRSDVYLLGAILYEILTGEAPHRGSSVHEVLFQAARGAVEWPEERAPGRNIPRELSRIAMRALAHDPEQRYPDVASFEQALRDYLAHEEALRLAEEGDRAFEVLERGTGLGRGERYAAYAEALGRYGQALYLWSDNEHAAQGQARAAMAYADEALASGDVGLAAAQLGVLERNPHAKASRVAAIRAAVVRRSAGRSRQVVAALVMAVLVGAAWTSRVAWQRWEEEKRHRVELRTERDRQVVAAFAAARDSDRAELARLRHRLGSDEFAALGDQAERLDEVIWAEQVLLWSQGRWGELWDSLCAMPAVDQHALTLRREVLAVPGLASSVMGAWLKSTEGTTGAALCRAFAEALRVGVAPSVVEQASLLFVRPPGGRAQGATGADAAGADAAGGGMPAWIEATTGRKERREERRAVLLRAALFGVALEAAREGGDQAAAQVLAAHLLPFRLAAVPFGPAALGAPVEAPQLLRGADGEWLALEPAMGGERWRSLPWGENKTVFTSLGASDGSVVVAGEGQLVRLGGARGDVLGRVMLGGRPVLLWPDPLDRTRLVVTVLTDQQRGYVEELRFREGRSEQPLLPGELLAAPTYDGVRVLRRRLREAALGELGLNPRDLPEPANLFSKEWSQAVRTDPRRATVERRVLAGLRTALERDPRNPDLWLMSVALMPDDMPPEERDALGRGVVEAAVELAPFGASRLGVALERRGLVAAADAVYERAAQRFLELGGNADLAILLVGSPIVYLRQLGGEHFRAGRVERALGLVETGRRFAGYVEGDNRFYHLYVRWLEKNGRQAEARRMAPRVVESEAAGGVALRPSGFIVGVDVLLLVVLLCPPLLFWLVLRAWRRARSTQQADMHARGMRTRWERTVAFAIHPVERLGCTFLAYTPRSERLAIFAISAVFLVATAFIAGSIRTVAEMAAVPLYVANGYPGNGGFLHHLEERLREGQGGAPELRLWAEGQRERGEVAAARAALERVLAAQPEDPVARNNLAVLEEEAGRIEVARAGYARAAASPGGPGDTGKMVARYNQARLAGTGESQRVDEARAALAWRDRLHAEALGNTRPLWARAGYHDLIAVLIGLDSVVARTWSAFVALLNGDFGAIGEVFGQPSDAPVSEVRTFLIDAGGYSAIFFGLLALLAMPFAVRPVAPGPPVETQGQRPGRRLIRRLVGRLLGRLFEIGALLVPGLYDLVRGQAALGALQVLVIAAVWGAHSTLIHGGLLGSMTLLSLNQDYFPGVEEVFYPELAWIGHLAVAVLVPLFVINVLLTYWRLRRAAVRAGS